MKGTMKERHMITPTFTAPEAQSIPIIHHTISSRLDFWIASAEASEMRANALQTSVRQAAEWLRADAPGRALEVLEAHL